MLRRFFILLTILAAALWMLAGVPRADAAPAERLVILFTHDLHSYFLPDRGATADGRTVERGGYAKLLTLIRQSSEVDRTLLVDAGDFSMGTLFHTSFMTEAAELRLMAAMGYDAMTLGNHDFDFHPEGLAKALLRARAAEKRLPAMVASNLVFSPEGKGDADLRTAFNTYPVVPYAVIERRGIRIGLFGILGKDAQVDAPFAKPVVFDEPVESSRKIVEILKNREKVDLIVCLSHSGTSPVKKRSEDENLARAVPGIDLIISGHTHTVLPRPIVVGKTLIVSSGAYGAYLGRIGLDYAPESGVSLASYDLKPVVPELSEDPALAREIAAFKEDVDREYLTAYGVRFDQAIAESAYDMETLEAAYNRPGETGIGDMITDAFRQAVEKAEGPRYKYIHVALEPLGVIRGSFLKGPITVADIFRTLSLGLGTDGRPGYPLVAYYITGKELKDLLEVETTVANLKRDAHLQFSGVNFSFNPHRIPFDRVTRIAVRNAGGLYEPVVPEALYRICMNFYTAQMVDYVRNASYGLLSITPRDSGGRPVADLEEGIIDAGALAPGTQEIKEWTALAAYMKSFPDTDGNGIPDLPARYRQPEGRFAASRSWNPIRLIAGGNGITYGLLAIGVLLHGLMAVLMGLAFRLIRKTSASGKKRPYRFFLGLVVSITVLLCAPTLHAIDIVPFNTKNQSPVVQIYGLPSAGNAALLSECLKEFHMTLDQSSNYVDDTNLRETLLFDGETTRLTIGGQYGLSKSLELGIEIPYVAHGGGFLDGFITDYHELFGFPQGGRDQAPRNRLLYRYSRDGVEKLKQESSGNGIGDISMTAGLQIYKEEKENPRAVALRASVKFPTGDGDSLDGSGSTDAAFWITASDDYPLSLGHATVFAAAGFMAMTEGDVLPEQQVDYVGFGSIGAGWNPWSWIAFKVQLDAHTPLYKDSHLKTLDSNAAQLLIGGTLGLSDRTTLDIAVSEDIVTTTSPDVVFHFALSTRF